MPFENELDLLYSPQTEAVARLMVEIDTALAKIFEATGLAQSDMPTALVQSGQRRKPNVNTHAQMRKKHGHPHNLLQQEDKQLQIVPNEDDGKYPP